MILTILAFIAAILLLVSLHELGHLLVARWCGIKVLRFSVGFGKPFFNKRWRNIEWCLAPIPLGGYVKNGGYPRRGGGGSRFAICLR